MDKICM